MKLFLKYFKDTVDGRAKHPFLNTVLNLDETIWRNSFDIINEIKRRKWDAFRLTNAPGLTTDASEYYIWVPPLGLHRGIMLQPLTVNF